MRLLLVLFPVLPRRAHSITIKINFPLSSMNLSSLRKPNEKIVISPPQVQQPEIKSNGKKVVITLQDTLKPNTTYTIDFADAIQDNNEGNPLENFFYSFSTGDRLTRWLCRYGA